MIDRKNIDDFLNLTDDEIRTRITSAARAGEISPDKLKSALGDTEHLRKVISKMNPADIERFIRILGRENAEKMAEKLKENL